MLSIGTEYEIRSPLAFVDDEVGPRWQFVDERQPQRATTHESNSTSTLLKAAAATAALKEEIDQLWRDSMSSDDGLAAERLVAVSHAIRRVSQLLDDRSSIG